MQVYRYALILKPKYANDAALTVLIYQLLLLQVLACYYNVLSLWRNTVPY